MKGRLTDQPLAELIREISSKGLSGTLRLEHERAQTAVYFDKGEVIYAASNLRTLRLREYLSKRGIGSEKDAAILNNNLSDLDLAAALTASGTLKQKDVDTLLELLAGDVLRVALLWTEGSWDFNVLARLNSPVRVKVDTPNLLREAAHRMPLTFVSARFRNPSETMSRSAEVPRMSNFLPAESFLLSRLDKPTALADLISFSGLPEPEAQRMIYGLALSGLVKREYWQNAFRTDSARTSPEQSAVRAPADVTVNETQPTGSWTSTSVEDDDLDKFLRRLDQTTNHYEVLEVPPGAKTSEIKDGYYAIARRYHPDRFHLKSGTKVHSQISSAFARVTQAYETLMNPNARAAYDHTLHRAQLFAASQAAKSAEAEPVDEFEVEGDGTESGGAEYSFREGAGALQQGRIAAAITHLSNASRLAPQEARYRAFYGRALAANENTRRLAENEIQAAVKLEPANAAFRTMLAELYFDLKFHRRAQTELDRALAIDPNNATAHSLLRKLQKSRKVG
jgi:curved DNA-binding protein CbpA